MCEQLSQHRIAYGDEVIAFHLRRQPSRSVTRVAIPVEPDARVLVDMPDTATLTDVLAAVKEGLKNSVRSMLRRTGFSLDGISNGLA